MAVGLKSHQHSTALCTFVNDCHFSESVPGWTNLCQMFSTLLQFSLPLLIYRDGDCVGVETWTFQRCQIARSASWIKHISRTIPYLTKAAQTNYLKLLETSPVFLYKCIPYPSSQPFLSVGRTILSKARNVWAVFHPFLADDQCPPYLPYITHNVFILQ